MTSGIDNLNDEQLALWAYATSATRHHRRALSAVLLLLALPRPLGLMLLAPDD